MEPTAQTFRQPFTRTFVGRLAGALILLALLLLAGARRFGPIPALGPLLDPAHGVWSMARAAEHPSEARAGIPHLSAGATVVYDDRAVPHIFAASEVDAYRALGYVVARDRLFQLYLQTMAASGRLTEVGGARLLGADREMRHLGLPRSAERKLAAASDTSEARRVMQAYSDGVNAYIDQMPATELPLEFRLLGITPPRWLPIDSYHLLDRMGWILANISLEKDRAAAASRVGAAAAAALFPDNSPIQEPVQPNGQRSARLDFAQLAPPGAPDSAAALVASALDAWSPDELRASGDADQRTMASNNWAVAPRRTADGHALLAGDPHLDLSLPSIWYEAHLVVPG
ncbi:MAG: peptidase penicillin amidase, partial [Gemmatimonadetes bacterium]|nr:peptidase penicillin amidase [Gemmatimonadota bacterium]